MAKNTKKDSERAAYMKAHNIVRKTQRCPQCYRIVACESNMSKYQHTCRG